MASADPAGASLAGWTVRMVVVPEAVGASPVELVEAKTY